MPVLIMGGILSGMFTPTEAAGVTVVYAVPSWGSSLPEADLEQLSQGAAASGLESGMVMLLIAISEPFPGSWRPTRSRSS